MFFDILFEISFSTFLQICMARPRKRIGEDPLKKRETTTKMDPNFVNGRGKF